MKRCTTCGKEQPDESSTCPFDGKPLVSVSTEKVAVSEKSNRNTKPKSLFLCVPGVILLTVGGGVNIKIYNYYENLPISFYINRGLDPRAPIALAMDKPTLLVYNLSSLAVFIGF